MTLPKDYNARKSIPLHDFLVGYFPDAITEVVRVAVAGNAQHNPGEKLHWARGKSTDQLNTAMRHIFDHSTVGMYDDEPPEVLAAINWEGEGYSTLHLAKAAWRLLAEIQLLVERRAEGRKQLAAQQLTLGLEPDFQAPTQPDPPAIVYDFSKPRAHEPWRFPTEPC